MRPMSTTMLAALSFLILAIPAAFADVHEIAKSNGWTAYAGRSEDNRAMCAVGATGGGRWFGMKYFTGDSALTIQMSKNTWKLRDGIRVAVTAQFDDHGKWSASAKGFHMSDGDGALEFTIPVKSIDTWVDEFKNSQRMIIRFPGQDIDDWQADLSGTENVTGPFGICIASVLMTN